MPEPDDIDLTARVADEEHARRADLARGERGMDILVIDDQPDHEARWFARHLPGHRRLSLESVNDLKRYLAGERLPNLPHPPYRPELAILDLSLGVGQPDGLEALYLLRLNPDTRDLPTILNTNGLEDHRDLLAVLAAQLNGGAIPVASKRSTDGPHVRDHARRVAHAHDADLPWPLTKRVPGLMHVKEILWEDDRGTRARLLDYLLDLPWKRTYWTKMAQHRNHQAAAFDARIRHGTLAASSYDGATESGPTMRVKQNHARFVANQFGPLVVALALAGNQLHSLDGRLSLIAAQQDDRFSQLSGNRGAHLVAFAARYGPVLEDPFIQSLPDHLKRLKPEELRP